MDKNEEYIRNEGKRKKTGIRKTKKKKTTKKQE